MRDLGEHRLKDLGRPERVFQVVHPALAAAFPPLATLDIQSHNLPVQPTPLIGQEREVAQLTDLLTRPDVRLVTLTGPGGTGKTRLALQAAAEVVEQFADGVWFVDLSPLTDPALVPSAIAGVLGVREEGGTPLAEVLLEYLRERQVLLVLDNLEQLVPGTASGTSSVAAQSRAGGGGATAGAAPPQAPAQPGAVGTVRCRPPVHRAGGGGQGGFRGDECQCPGGGRDLSAGDRYRDCPAWGDPHGTGVWKAWPGSTPCA